MLKTRINGHQLAQHIGDQVVILGTISRKSSSGKSIELTTTDEVVINVSLPEPLDSNAEGYIEVCGTLQSKSTMTCNTYKNFPESETENFVAEHYNDVISMYNVLGNTKWQIIKDPGY